MFGTCCHCGTDKGVTNLLALDRLCPMPGKGWGCLVCDLEPNGAVAVLCDKCAELAKTPGWRPAFVCTGYPKRDGRTAWEETHGVWKHDMTRHPGEKP